MIVAASDADVVMRQLIVSLGGLCVGSALVFAWWHLRSGQPRRFVTGMLLLSFVIIALLTTDHIYRHLVADDAPLWQLWGALIAFSIGAYANIAALVQIRRTGRPPPPPA
jgi:hypothetical protein